MSRAVALGLTFSVLRNALGQCHSVGWRGQQVQGFHDALVVSQRHVMEQGEWTVLSFPAIAEVDEYREFDTALGKRLYLPQERSLAIDVEQAIRVRHIFSLYLDLGCVSQLKAEIDRKGWLTPVRSTQRADAKGNQPFSRGHLYRILGNPIYIGQIRHKDETFPGNHPALINQDTWESVQAQLQANRQRTKGKASAINPSPLAGLVYDADGQRLTPTHAKKGSRRYRYYIQTTEEGTSAMRIPAQELEDAVAQGILDFLQDGQRLIAWCNARGLTQSHAIEAVLTRAHTAAQALQQSTKRQLPQLIARVTAQTHQLDISMKMQVLAGEESEENAETIGLTMPVELRRRGLALKLVVGNTHTAQTADPRIIALLVKAHDWWGRLTSGISRGVGEIAQQENVTSSYVTRVINLAFIAPDIVQRLASGNYPSDLTADKLIRMVPLPADWQTQRRLFRMSD